jgi:hypothetical protein
VSPDPADAEFAPGSVGVRVDPATGLIIPSRKEGSEGG